MKMKKMNGKTFLPVYMVIALCMLTACGSSHTPLMPYDEAASKWDAIVDEHIADTGRASWLKQYGRQLDHLQTSLAADIQTVNEKLIALNADYGSTKDDM